VKLLAALIFLTSCAPVGQPASTCPAQVEQAKPAHEARSYFDCGKQIACGVWCRVSDECREIEREMKERAE
jgi:hypothetical protein